MLAAAKKTQNNPNKQKPAPPHQKKNPKPNQPKQFRRANCARCDTIERDRIWPLFVVDTSIYFFLFFLCFYLKFIPNLFLQFTNPAILAVQRKNMGEWLLNSTNFAHRVNVNVARLKLTVQRMVQKQRKKNLKKLHILNFALFLEPG